MILKIYDPRASIVKPSTLSRMKDLGETFYVFFVILMILYMLGTVLEVTISPPFVIFSILWRLTAITDNFLWKILSLGSTLILLHICCNDVCLVLKLAFSFNQTFMATFILLNLIINVIIKQIFDFLTSREHWVTLYVIFTILIQLKILGIIHIDIEYIMLLCSCYSTAFSSVLNYWIVNIGCRSSTTTSIADWKEMSTLTNNLSLDV